MMVFDTLELGSQWFYSETSRVQVEYTFKEQYWEVTLLTVILPVQWEAGTT